MKNIVLMFCLFLVTCCFVSAQTPSVENWQTFAPAAEEFSVEAPAAFSALDLGERNGKINSRRYKNIFDGTYFFIFSDAERNIFQTKVVRDFVQSFQKSGSSFPAGNLTGEKFNFADDGDFYHTILFVKTNSRSYVFHTVSPIENNPQVERFFAGIRFENILPVQNNVVTDGKEKNISAVEVKKFGIVAAGDTGGRSGNGTGSDAGQTNPQTPVLQTTSLKILSKPRPAYTEFARFYEITGTIRTRITFLASGEIGTIKPVTKLPFGLVNQAVIAARSIRFEPAMQDGQPVSVTKQVEYQFTIY